MPSEQRGMSPKERKGSPKTVRTPETVERINVSIQTGKYNEDIVINGIWIHLKKYLLIDVVSLEALQFSPFLNQKQSSLRAQAQLMRTETVKTLRLKREKSEQRKDGGSRAGVPVENS
ncbi:hypothetical protein TNCV_1139002 [Trichonephila clavipes]|nr:hypothetical protein TNCV_1139002 [Trichonephila clavipes]